VSRAGGRYVETFRFASVGELTRQGGRLTIADLSLHERLRATHAGEAAPSIRVSPVAGASRDGWLTERIVICLERALDETINGVARVRGRPDRTPLGTERGPRGSEKPANFQSAVIPSAREGSRS
jgi:hypothetical protein